MATRRVVARNWATASDNKIHDDEVARRYGFRGGLVPGVTLFAYLVPSILADQGDEWLGGGWVEVRFDAPVYEGASVEACCDQGELTLSDEDGTACVTGSAWRARAGLLDRALRAAPLPPERPPASRDVLAPGRLLGSVGHLADPAAMASYLSAVGEDPQRWLDRRLAHPGWLLLEANEVLVRNVVLGPWIHVGSRLRLLQRVELGAVLETRAEVATQDERKGHQFVELDVVVLADGQPAATVRHTAIWQPRPPS